MYIGDPPSYYGGRDLVREMEKRRRADNDGAFSLQRELGILRVPDYELQALKREKERLANEIEKHKLRQEIEELKKQLDYKQEARLQGHPIDG
jgi:hypothetical protein